MNARLFIILIALIQLLFYVFEAVVIENYRKKPLPIEVSDIYEEKRYQTYLNYAKDNRKLSIVLKTVSLITLCILTYSNMYAWIEKICAQNVYLIFILTYLIYTLVESIESYGFHYFDTFKIEEKYGLNKKDFKEFNREFYLDLIGENALMVILYLLLIFIGEHLPIWTNHFSLSFINALMISFVLVGIIVLFVIFANLMSLALLKKQYTFTGMPEGKLKDKINELQKDVKKQVKVINIYDESKKSTSKNAFLLRFLWIREFGIADNFMNENAESELLAVLSHEIGHLKHKKNLLDYSMYLFALFVFIILVYLLVNIEPVDQLLLWICNSFGISTNNYYLNISVFMNLFTPLLFLFNLYRNFNIRLQEYEADREAVKNGYGEELISTFKKLSSDELVNVNPSPIIEFLEYDHPGMYNRIKAIKEYQKEIGHS